MYKKPKIYFYIPKKDWPQSGFLSDPDKYWCGWVSGGYGLTSGVYCWIVLTFLNLINRGFACELVGEMPNDGIIIAHRISLEDDFKPSATQYIICVTADKKAHPHAQYHIVPDEKNSTIRCKHKKTIPHWIQPGLIPRDPKRGARFENIAYLGMRNNIASELTSADWQKKLLTLGLNFSLITEKEKWNDFSHLDAIIAVRTFNGGENVLKPPQKLLNAWKAGVPTIIGRERGCRALRKSTLDYAEASSIDEVFEHLKKLKMDERLRIEMAENGKKRAIEFSGDNITRQWVKFFKTVAVPSYFRRRFLYLLKSKFLRLVGRTLRQ